MDTFKKHFIDAENNYKIGYWPYDISISANIFQKYVNNDKPLYTDWLAVSGNVPEEVAYVPPIQPPPLTLDQKRIKVQNMITNKQNNLFDNGFSLSGNNFPSDSQYREIMNTGARLGQEAIDNSQTISVSAFTTSGTVVMFDEHEVIELRDAYDTYGLNIYNNFINEMGIWSTATSAQIDYYILSGEFE